MCLYLKDFQLASKIAETDIPCYKFFMEHDGGELRSIFFNKRFKYEPNSLHKTQLQAHISWGTRRGTVTQGFHSFTDKITESWIIIVDLFIQAIIDNELEGKLCYYKCHIPAGSEYYKGEWDYNIPSYTSNSIVLDEEIPLGPLF